MAVESVSRRSMGEVAKQGGSRSGENTDIPVLATAYAFGLVRNIRTEMATSASVSSQW